MSTIGKVDLLRVGTDLAPPCPLPQHILGSIQLFSRGFVILWSLSHILKTPTLVTRSTRKSKINHLVNDSTTAPGQISTVNFFQHLDCFYLPFVIKIESVFYTKDTLKQGNLPKTTESQAKGFTTKMQIYTVNLRAKNIQLTKKSYIFEQFITRSKTWLHTFFKIGDKITNSSFHCEANQRKCLYSRLAHYFTQSETSEEL